MNRLLVALIAVSCFTHSSYADLKEYVQKKDAAFQWKLVRTVEAESGTAYTIDLVSQKWQGIVWDHTLVVVMPKGSKPGDTIFLWNDGGKPSSISSLVTFELARRSKVPMAFLYGIPKQPLFEGKREDHLIAETFVRYLQSKDESWPLLFPMVKSLVRAMDCLEEFSKKEWKTDVKSFVVAGASKRGWTAWLTGAIDSRVKAISPMVIDTLNFQKQLPHQMKSYGKPSDMIAPYTLRGLVPIPNTPIAEKLWQMIDPWVYRKDLEMPKLIVNGCNDPYWTQDALNLYWDDLKGDKWVLYVPNAGHGLEETLPDGSKSRIKAISTVAAYAYVQANKKSFPKLSWEHATKGDQLTVKVASTTKPIGARLWYADSATRDFRKSQWKSVECTDCTKEVSASVGKPSTGFRCLFLESDYNIDEHPLHLSTQLRIVGTEK
ncbi:MAG: PhoPQ-activated protein PqaA family protein [Zavarzinella sp.]